MAKFLIGLFLGVAGTFLAFSLTGDAQDLPARHMMPGLYPPSQHLRDVNYMSHVARHTSDANAQVENLVLFSEELHVSQPPKMRFAALTENTKKRGDASRVVPFDDSPDATVRCYRLNEWLENGTVVAVPCKSPGMQPFRNRKR